jgi:hypothetical protein
LLFFATIFAYCVRQAIVSTQLGLASSKVSPKRYYLVDDDDGDEDDGNV